MNLDLSSLKCRIIIVSFLSLLIYIPVHSQDLEEEPISSPDAPVSKQIEVNEGTHIIEDNIAAPLSNPISNRNPDTYRKNVYIQKMLRQTYYHKLTTSPWSKYLKPKGWMGNVKKWRYWDHLKTYITGNDKDILILREPEKTMAAVEDPIEEVDVTTPDTPVAAIAVAPVTLDTQTTTAAIKEPTPDPSKTPEILETKYEVVYEAPWIKDTILYEYGDDQKEEIAETQKEIAQEDKKEVVEEADKTVLPKNEIVVAEQKEDINTTTSAPPVEQKPQDAPIVVTPKPVASVPPATSFSNSGLAPEAFGSLKGNLSWPVSGRITDSFGTRTNAEARGLSPNNYGIDMLCPAGSNVRAVHGGTVLLARRQSPYDVIVTIKHGDYTSAYYYLITPYVNQGDVVQAGQSIGQLRTSVEEADFHFEIWFNQERMNPEHWLK